MQRYKSTAAMRYFLLLISVFCTSVLTPVLAASSTYAVVLASMPGTGNNWQAGASNLFEGYTLYVSSVTVKGKQWERLNLGFFNTRKQAGTYAKQLQKKFPGAWVNSVDSNEVALSNTTALSRTAASKPATTRATSSTANKSSLSDTQLDSLMLRAKSEFTNANYAQAVRYFGAIDASGENKYSREALELLGLARHRNGQKAHARALYEKYISRYPEGEATDRVKQRLSGLLTETAAPRDKMRMTTDKPGYRVDTYGSLSQFYRNDTVTTSDAGSINTLSQLITFFDITNVIKNDNLEHRIQFTADDTYDFLNDGTKNEFRFIEMYYDFSLRDTGTSARVGRQTLRIGGLLNRFDGASAGYQITPDMRLNILAGLPVETTNKSSLNDHKKLYGLTFETGTFFNYWDMTLFHIIQTVDGIDDHISTGTEIQYRDKAFSAFGLIDYDTVFKTVNIAQINTNMRFESGQTAYLNAFLRKSPILTASNALIGRTEASIEELMQTLSIEQIYQLARDRTSNSQTITVGGSQPLTEKTQVSADLTFSRVGSTVASGGVPATESTGTDYYLGAQFVGNGLIMTNDTSVFGFRLLNTKLSDTISLIANARFPITRNWRINPRLQYDIRKLSDGRKQNKLRSLIRTDYRYQKKVRLDFEIGYDDTSESSDTGAFNNSSFFYSLGYRYDF